MNIKDKAKEYAEGKAMNALTAAIESAYAEGYNAGFNDGVASKEGEKPDDLDDGVEYVDLGLPSGTKWAADYLKDKDGNIIYLTYGEAEKLNIPTMEQYKELHNNGVLASTKNDFNDVIEYAAIGTNGNSIHYKVDGYYQAEKKINCIYPQFWLRGKPTDRTGFNLIFGEGKTDWMFVGYKFPVILVK
jgi:hypothetical protein